MSLIKLIALGLLAWVASTVLAMVILQPALAVFVSTASVLSPTVALAFVAGIISNAWNNITDPVGFALVVWPITVTILVVRRQNATGIRWDIVVVTLLTLFLVTATHNIWIGRATAALACVFAVIGMYRRPKLTINT